MMTAWMGPSFRDCGWRASSTPRRCARCLTKEFPRLRYAAALLGPGSEVLGFDTERSTDHDWGPRLQVFLGADEAERHAGPVTEMLAERLPLSSAATRSRSASPGTRAAGPCTGCGSPAWAPR